MNIGTKVKGKGGVMEGTRLLLFGICFFVCV